MLIKVVMPFLSSESDNDLKDSVRRLLIEFANFGLSSIRAEGASIHIFPENVEKIISNIEDALISISHDKVVDGLMAIFTILQNPQKSHIESEILKLLNLLGQKIKWRQKTGLVSALNIANMLIREESRLFAEELEDSILTGLRRIADETNFEIDPDLNFDKKLELRQSAACLAYTIYQNYSNQNKKLPDVIQLWGNICQSENEFAEIKNEWIHMHDKNNT